MTKGQGYDFEGDEAS
jgi:hypothetical protein